MPINTVIEENEKCVFYFMEKNITDFLANPISLPNNLLPPPLPPSLPPGLLFFPPLPIPYTMENF